MAFSIDRLWCIDDGHIYTDTVSRYREILLVAGSISPAINRDSKTAKAKNGKEQP